MMLTRQDQELIEVMCSGLSREERARTIQLMEEGNRQPDQGTNIASLDGSLQEPDNTTSPAAVIR